MPIFAPLIIGRDFSFVKEIFLKKEYVKQFRHFYRNNPLFDKIFKMFYS